MTERIKLTKTNILAFALPDRGARRTIYDTDVPKLAIRITSAGARSFIWSSETSQAIRFKCSAISRT